MPGFQLTIDCGDPDRLARFWAEALPGYRLEEPPDGHPSWRSYWRSIGVPEDELADGYDSLVSDTGPRIWFQYVPEAKSVKNRLHFDLLVGGGRSVAIEERRARVRAEAERLVAAGATVLREMDAADFEHFFIAMADPEGNEFDLV